MDTLRAVSFRHDIQGEHSFLRGGKLSGAIHAATNGTHWIAPKYFRQ